MPAIYSKNNQRQTESRNRQCVGKPTQFELKEIKPWMGKTNTVHAMGVEVKVFLWKIPDISDISCPLPKLVNKTRHPVIQQFFSLDLQPMPQS